MEDLCVPLEMVIGEEEGCHSTSATELRVRLGDEIWRKQGEMKIFK